MKLLGLPVQPRSAFSTSWMLLCALVAAQVAALYPVDEDFCLLHVSAQRGCFHPHRASPAVPAGDILAFYPGQLFGRLVQLMAQRADQLHSLGSLTVTHDANIASSLSFAEANRSTQAK
jgi:hypothetical protein